MANDRIRLLTTEDLEFAQNLRSIAGWNQTDQDWVRLLRLSPDGCFLYEKNGQPAATATTLCYGQDLAWIGMILVHPDFRRQGIATQLLEFCLDTLLNQKQIRCVKLDASPEGQPVYEKLGFQEEYGLSRWTGIPTFERLQNHHNATTRPIHLDQQAFGVDRMNFLNQLARDSLKTNQSDDRFGMIRTGSLHTYLGPVIADNQAAGRAQILNLLAIAPKESIYWDIPDDNVDAIQLAKEMGLQKERPLLRMWLGNPVPSDPTLQWAITGPESG